MVKTHWEDLEGETVRYADHSWEFTGAVEVLGTGEMLAIEATQLDDVRHGRATLRFGLENPPASLNPGDIGERFDRLERQSGRHQIVVSGDHRTYRYQLNGFQRR